MSDASSPAPPPYDGDLSGRQLGDYLLLRRLGQGAMAEVYLAEQTSLRRQVAFKVLRRELSADDTYVKRFHNEAQAAAALVHANIVQIHDIGCREGIHYIAQEYVRGQNLRELIARQGPPDVRASVTIIRQVALALQKAAERGIVHRDIKPENIMLTREQEVKVADFGLARLLDRGAELNLTQVGITMGTPLYMSPEQVEGKAIDPRSDIYSLGVTCFHMLTGNPPFNGETALSVAVQHLKTQPKRLEQLRPDLPPALCRIVHKMLAKNPDDRYAAPRDLLFDLRGVQVDGLDNEWWESVGFETVPMMAIASTGRFAATQRLAEVMQTQTLAVVQRKRRGRWLALGLVAAFIVGGSLAWRMREPSLLADAREEIPIKATAREQLVWARLQPLNREAWFQSIIDNFKGEKDRDVVNLARQDLARLILLENKPDKPDRAMPVLKDLEHESVPQSSARAFSLAGQAVVLTAQGDLSSAARKLGEVLPLRDKLDPQMKAMLLYPLEENRKALSQQDAQLWDEWKKNLPVEED